ncbi:hypothetical protein Lal_00033224 [Lupinus albus]|nr:hypothetical protein Lal_00033224 [Lupinus albus]
MEEEHENNSYTTKSEKKKIRKKEIKKGCTLPVGGICNNNTKLILKNFCLANKPDLIFISNLLVNKQKRIKEHVEVSCSTLPRSSSDHHPLLLCSSSSQSSRKSSFKFHSMWLEHQGCRKVILNSWSVSIYGCPILKVTLKHWNINVFCNIQLKVRNAMIVVEVIQNCINDSGVDEDLLGQEVVAKHQLMEALNMKEKFWREKTRIKWHTRGDRNTNFFHKVTKIRQVTKSMSLFRDWDNILTTHDEISGCALNYFTNLFGSSNNCNQNNLIPRVIPSLVSDAKNIVGMDVFNFVKQFFNQGWILPNMNSNVVILIPKIANVDHIED